MYYICAAVAVADLIVKIKKKTAQRQGCQIFLGTMYQNGDSVADDHK
jgi:hypothetical protein